MVLVIIFALILVYVFVKWVNSPVECPKHGKSHMYQHGYYDEWDCSQCQEEMIKKHYA